MSRQPVAEQPLEPLRSAPITYEKLFLQERKKARVLLGTTIVLAGLFVGALVINPKQNAAQPTGLFGANGTVQRPDGMMGPRQTAIKELFTSDGSVDQTAVSKLLANVPSDFKQNMLERFSNRIDNAVDSGDITQSQATALKKALGITSSTSTTTTTTGTGV